MPGVAKEQVEQLRQIDLLTYMQRFEPQNLKQSAANEYCLTEHPSLKISNGKWYWFSHQFGGTSALDFLCAVRGYGFLDAVETLIGGQIRDSDTTQYNPPPVKPTAPPKTLVMPPAYRSNAQMTAYLVNNRGIARDWVEWCIALNILYEDVRHNCVFVGRDERGDARYVSLRGTAGEFKGEAQGSDKRYGFIIPPTYDSNHLVITESAIDALSLASMSGGRANSYYLSLGGTSPAAALRFIDTNANITTVSLCLDNDEAGILGANRLAEQIRERFTHRRIAILNSPPTKGKDYNEELLNNLNVNDRGGESYERTGHGTR
jgi:hypothetical protein